MNFALFILLNAVLLIRPEELYPEIEGLRLYLIVIVLCVVTSLPQMAAQLSWQSLKRRPITVCVLGMLGAVTISLLVRGRLDLVEEIVPEFAKVIVYYLLLVSLVDSPQRLRTFLGWQVLFVTVVAALGLAQYHEYINIDAIRPIVDRRQDPETGEYVEILRLCSSGIFNDPNDLCLLLVFGGMCCVYRAVTAGNWLTTALWLLPIAPYGYTLTCTESRGGMLGLMAALAGLFFSRLRWKLALPLVVLCVGALMAGGGRQSQLTGDTAHERLMIWADGITELMQRPAYLVTGLGANLYGEETGGQVAHNSFVHAYVELGLLGGGLFLGAFVSAVWMLFRVSRTATLGRSRALTVTRSVVIGMVMGYVAGVYSLSRNYIVPTYMCLGIACSYLGMVMPDPPPQFQVNEQWVRRLVYLSVVGFVFLKLFTQYAGVLGV